MFSSPSRLAVLAIFAGCNVVIGYADLEPTATRSQAASTVGPGGGGTGGGSGGAGGATVDHVLGGTVLGLDGALTLGDGTGQQLNVNMDGDFAFDQRLPSGSDYDITLMSQPADQWCGICNGSGTIEADVHDVHVRCLQQQPTYVKAANPTSDALFGRAIAMDGDTLIVGAPGDAATIGAAYVFVRVEGVWEYLQSLSPQMPSQGNLFGWSVDISGDSAVISALGEGAYRGSIYIFQRVSGMWSEQARRLPSNGEPDDHFGQAVAIDGDHIVVGAHKEDGTNDLVPNGGALYVFQRENMDWTERTILRTGSGEQLGFDVAVSGDTIAAGAPHESTGGNSSGAAYVFVGAGASWLPQPRLKALGLIAGNQFGGSIDVHEDTMVVGSYFLGGSGAAWVFERTGGAWSEEASLKADNAESGDRFAISVAVLDSEVLVGADFEDGSDVGVGGDQTSNAIDRSGAAYLFTRDVDGWRQLAYLRASNPGENDGFGRTVAGAGTTLVVGAMREDSAEPLLGGMGLDNSALGAGAIYIFD